MQFLEARGSGRVLERAEKRIPDTFTLPPG